MDSRKRLPDGREISVELSHDEVMDIVRQFVTSGELREELQGKLVKGGWRVVKFPDALWGKLK